MKKLLSIITVLLLVCFAAATPVSVVCFIYDWAANDIAFKVALWSSVKLWMSLLGLGALGFVGAFCHKKAPNKRGF